MKIAFDVGTGTTIRPSIRSAPHRWRQPAGRYAEHRRGDSLSSRYRGPVPKRDPAGFAWIGPGREVELLTTDPIGLIPKVMDQAKRLGEATEKKE